MFRVLSSEESHLVKKWRAPSLEGSGESPGENASTVVKSLVADDVTATDIANMRHVVNDAQINTLASNDEFTAVRQNESVVPGKHAGLAISNPSADMLQQSYDEGFAAGVSEKGPSTDNGITEQLRGLLDSLAPQKYQIDAELEHEVVSLSKAIAKMVLRRELEIDNNVIVDIVHSALAQLPKTSEPPVVVLNPTDLDLVQSLESAPSSATLVPDPVLKRGTCRVEIGASILDAGLDALVDSISSNSSESQILPAHESDNFDDEAGTKTTI